VVRTNLTGGFLMARECYNQWMGAHGGAVVNIVADFWSGMPGMGHSGAARAGMVNFTETAALEWAPAGVRVNAVAPGWIASSGFDTYDSEFTFTGKGCPSTVPRNLDRVSSVKKPGFAAPWLISRRLLKSPAAGLSQPTS